MRHRLSWSQSDVLMSLCMSNRVSLANNADLQNLAPSCQTGVIFQRVTCSVPAQDLRIGNFKLHRLICSSAGSVRSNENRQGRLPSRVPEQDRRDRHVLTTHGGQGGPDP